MKHTPKRFLKEIFENGNVVPSRAPDWTLPICHVEKHIPLMNEQQLPWCYPKIFLVSKKKPGPENLGDFPSFSPTAMEPWVPWREIWGLLLSPKVWTDLYTEVGQTFQKLRRMWSVVKHLEKDLGFLLVVKFFCFCGKYDELWWEWKNMVNACFKCFFLDRSERDV